jgi:pimeloyl-ACP methyl ester carboxylesterase
MEFFRHDARPLRTETHGPRWLRESGLLLILALLALCGSVAAVPGSARAASHAAQHHKRHAKGRKRKHHRGTPAEPGVRTLPVTFRVVNDNETEVSCLPNVADGKTYTVSGSLILPAGATPAGVTLYAHGLGFASYFWDFTAVPGYDYAGAEAAAGHASVVIDRLGYGKSSIPPGDATCVGSQATILHEIVQDLRAGRYTATGSTTPPSFSRVGLVGHSAGSQLAEVEAYTFKDIDALGVMEWADQFYSLGTYTAFGLDAVQCVEGNVKQVGSSSTGYATFGTTDAQYDSLMFADVDPAVEAAANALRTNDPCGQIESILTATAIDILNVGSIKVPIAYVHAGDDGIFQAGLPWPSLQESLYRGTSKLTDISLPGEGHAVTLERSAPKLDTAMSTWLTANGL